MARSQEDYDRQILQAIASGQRITQRSLSREMGVALGLTNLLVKRLVTKGYLKIAKIGTRHARYLMTAEGWDALGHATRLSLQNTLRLYTQTRDQIRTTLNELSDRCECTTSEKRIVFYGGGDVAEIAYISLQTTDLQLVGVVDDARCGKFFGFEILSSEDLSPDALAGHPYDHVLVTSIRQAEQICRRLDEREVPRARVSVIC